MNYARFINSISVGRKPSPLREMTALLARSPPSLVFLATGSPNPEMFPFKEATVTLQDGTTLNLAGNVMKSALQYGPTPGYGPLVTQLKEMVKKLHNPPCFSDMDLIVTSGSQDGLCKAFEMSLKPGDYVLLQEPTYPGTIGILRPYSPKYLVVAGDKDGMIPESLQEILKRWNTQEAQTNECVAPKLLYINPNGANPTGTTLSLERRKAIYQLAQEYNLLILEDDPYYFLHYADETIPSFLSMDTDGRVLRFDSFSKILSAGMRVGFVSGPKPLLERIALHMQVSLLQGSSLSQVLISELLQKWGPEGFHQHVKKVRSFYEQQKNIMAKSARKWLPGLVEWDEPVAGMFLWMKVHGVKDTYNMIMEKALAKEVVLMPGRHFMTDDTKPCPYLRAAFSLASEDKINTGFERLAQVIREEQAMQK